ncbi:P-loop containing nucleoside triphosphate hydrolase protein [Mycena metata]|uniref:DNA 3'-5' helicase n=1 Tax=Mycena metata TaxID=1033252 RepID=A0AAD7HDN8_9AGAR|nr:P-loop containing nucleoside triphosphate hydrolase protein [Mycena metata]
MSSADEHLKRTADSQRILQAAREKARQKNGYDSAQTRRDLARLFEADFKKPPYAWQIDVSEAMVLGLDAVVIAGTGAGKTIPFMMPLLLDRSKFVLVISPLKILQEDQAKRFRKMGLKAAAVNGDTYTRELQQARQFCDAHRDLRTQTHNAIFTSPEMCFEHQDFRKYLRDDQTGKRIRAVIIDEAHCASQWGGDFRPHYALLHRLRSLLPVGTPILATSATLSPSALSDVCSGLDLDLRRSFFINLGNDRPNITPSVAQIKSSKDYEAVYAHLPDPADVRSAADLPKTIVFANAVKKTQVLCRTIRRRYCPEVRDAIVFLHSHRTAKSKRRIMKEFRKGKIKILVATEAAGMGADIRDIELIIQFGVPSSLSVWTQRAGRAGRSPELQARAILLVECSMFQRRKKRKRGATKGKAQSNPEPESSDSDSGSDSDQDERPIPNAHTDAATAHDPAQQLTPEPADEQEWAKKVDPVLREYISTVNCRRDASDLHFNNPPRSPPSGECCDNCTLASRPPPPPTTPPPQTPAPAESPTSSAHSTPSKNRNANGKRAMTYGRGPVNRRKDLLKSARAALERWRINTCLKKYGDTFLTPEVLLPDKFLTSLASRRVETLPDLAALIPSWAFADEHLADILRVLSRVDAQYRAAQDEAKKARAATRAATRTAARALENIDPVPQRAPKRRGRPPKARAPLASTSANTISSPMHVAGPHVPYSVPDMVTPSTPMSQTTPHHRFHRQPFPPGTATTHGGQVVPNIPHPIPHTPAPHIPHNASPDTPHNASPHPQYNLPPGFIYYTPDKPPQFSCYPSNSS